jgi:putative transposase
MPRRPRFHVDHVPLHIVQRGHNRERCFFEQADYQRYLGWLHEALTDAECTLHAYVLMTNHVHLLLTPRRAAAVPGAIISLGRRYVGYVNRTYKRTGTLWDSRYKSSLVQSNRYFLSCQRYIELNPVRAGIVRDPADYPWSSYRAHALGKPADIVSPHALYCALGRDGPERQRAYRKLFDQDPDRTDVEDIRLAVTQSRPVGDIRFHDAVEEVAGEREEPRRRGRPGKDH